VQAPRVRGAGIVGTEVAVVAIHQRPDTDSLLAMVFFRTGITVVARLPCERLVGAALFSQAGVSGARVSIVAQLAIDLTVAIIVHAVADLHGGNGGIAIGEPLFGTDSLSGADPVFVFHPTACGQREFFGFLCTLTLPGLGHALGDLTTLHSDRSLADVPLRTDSVIRAIRAAETAVRAKVKADVFGSIG